MTPPPFPKFTSLARAFCLAILFAAPWTSPAAHPLDPLAEAVLHNDLEALRKLTNSPPPGAPAADWTSAAAQAVRILDWPKAIIDSFRQDIGQNVMVVSSRGTISATVAGVSGGEVRLRVPVNNGFVEQTISIGTLSRGERDRRLAEYSAAEKEMVAALTALRSGRHQEAAAMLQNAADAPLAALMLAAIQRRASETHERDAIRALRRLLALAGFADVQEPGEQAVETIRQKEFDPDRGRIIREECAGFSNRFASTHVAAEWAAVWSALAGADTRSRAISNETVLAALDTLARKNSIGPGMQSGHLIRDGKVELNLAGNAALKDLSPLEKLPISDLDLSGTGVRSLAPLKSMPIERLVLDGTPLESLRGIEGCPLRFLSITNSAIADLRALKGAPLEFVNLYRSKVKSLAGLEGAPLRDLTIAETMIADIEPLAGAPLTNFNASSCTALVDIRPIAGAPLQSLYLWASSVADFRAVAQMPLKILHCMRLADLSLISNAPLEYLIISYSPLTDLRPIKGKQITALAFSYCPEISDLAPLEGMPLLSLDLTDCPKIADISPLRGMPLTSLVLDGTSAGNNDMAILRDGLPSLAVLFIGRCRKINNLEFLLALKSLSAVSLPPGAKAVPVLEKHPAIAVVYENGIAIPVKEFIASHGGKKPD